MASPLKMISWTLGIRIHVYWLNMKTISLLEILSIAIIDSLLLRGSPPWLPLKKLHIMNMSCKHARAIYCEVQKTPVDYEQQCNHVSLFAFPSILLCYFYFTDGLSDSRLVRGMGMTLSHFFSFSSVLRSQSLIMFIY